jgi:hypothetical protein
VALDVAFGGGCSVTGDDEQAEQGGSKAASTGHQVSHAPTIEVSGHELLRPFALWPTNMPRR